MPPTPRAPSCHTNRQFAIVASRPSCYWPVAAPTSARVFLHVRPGAELPGTGMCQRRAHPARLNAHGRPWPVAACKALVITSSAGPYMGTLRIRPRPTNGGGRARCCAAQSRGWSPNGLDAFDHCGNIAHFKCKGAPPGRRLQGRRCCPNHRAKRGLVTVILLDQTGDVLGDSTVRCVAPVRDHPHPVEGSHALSPDHCSVTFRPTPLARPAYVVNLCVVLEGWERDTPPLPTGSRVGHPRI